MRLAELWTLLDASDQEDVSDGDTDLAAETGDAQVGLVEEK